MLIKTLIKPRRTGNVILRLRDKKAFVFAPREGSPDLVCEVPDADSADVLALDQFEEASKPKPDFVELHHEPRVVEPNHHVVEEGFSQRTKRKSKG